MLISRKAATCFLIAVLALSFTGSAQAALCGFPTLVGAGLVAGGTNYVVIASPVAPFPVLGLGTTPIPGVIGEQCRDIWRDATLGPPPPNFLVVTAAAPQAAALCGGPCFVVGVAFCTAPGGAGASLCLAFP